MGVPQGSLLGLHLFNVAIDNFELASPNVEEYNLIGGNGQPQEIPKIETDSDDKPVPDETDSNTRREELLTVLKYIDNILILEKSNHEVTLTTDDVEIKHCVRIQNAVRRIIK